jgi:hypothetical protein
MTGYIARLETIVTLGEDSCMNSAFHHTDVAESSAGAQIVADCLSAGKQVPPNVAQRVRERADQARKLLFAAHGIQDIGVQIIREIRGELL